MFVVLNLAERFSGMVIPLSPPLLPFFKLLDAKRTEIVQGTPVSRTLDPHGLGLKKIGSSPNRVGRKEENDSIAQAQGGIPPRAGQHRRERPGVGERLPGFRKAPVP